MDCGCGQPEQGGLVRILPNVTARNSLVLFDLTHSFALLDADRVHGAVPIGGPLEAFFVKCPSKSCAALAPYVSEHAFCTRSVHAAGATTARSSTLMERALAPIANGRAAAIAARLAVPPSTFKAAPMLVMAARATAVGS